jgi:hypothetical protein
MIIYSYRKQVLDYWRMSRMIRKGYYDSLEKRYKVLEPEVMIIRLRNFMALTKWDNRVFLKILELETYALQLLRDKRQHENINRELRTS